MKLIVGLGNPGKEYNQTRHNIGYTVVDNYLDNNIIWKKDKLAYYYKTSIHNEDVLFIKPITYMNLSGQAVSYYMNYYKVDIKDILIIQDDMDLDIGKIRLKVNSTSGGHNGIKDIIKSLNSNEFLRLKIGISKPNYNIIDFVLSKFTKDEQLALNKIYPITKNIIEDFIKNTEVERLMSKYN